MNHLISEAAELSGLSASTIRYYEDTGLVRAAERDVNGYRIYDDRDVARLRFVHRARQLDLPLADLKGLVTLWDVGNCSPVAERLRETVEGRQREIQKAIVELSTLAAELQHARSGLTLPEQAVPCGDDCVCAGQDRTSPRSSLPLVESGGAEHVPIACTLEPGQIEQRMQDWQSLLEQATSRTAIEAGISLGFTPDPTLAAGLAATAADEQGCCSFYRFDLRITGHGLFLDVTAPDDAQPMLTSIFGPADT